MLDMSENNPIEVDTPFLGMRVFEERTAAKATQAALAKAINIDPSLLSRIEAGEVGLSAERALKIAKALEISIGRLYGESKL